MSPTPPPKNFALAALLLLLGLAHLSAQKLPNFLVIVVDDLGYMDIGANNPDCFYETPNIDAFAKSGMRFTDGYASNPVCSPTRYSLITGRYPTRVGATNFFSGKRSGKFNPAPLNDKMPLEDITIAPSPQGQRLRHLLCRQMAPRTHRRILSSESWLRH